MLLKDRVAVIYEAGGVLDAAGGAAIQAQGEGYPVYVVTDPSGDTRRWAVLGDPSGRELYSNL